MADPEHWAKLEDSVAAWNRWRSSLAVAPDLSDVDLSRRDLSGADLHGVDLRGVSFTGSILLGASFREANLRGVDLTVAQRRLQTEQFAGADLTGATLPPELTKLYDSLQNVNNISESARKLFLAVLAACLYSWLTIATTTDVNLITNRASSPLPIIQTSIPIVGFYWVAPLLLLCVYFYFHFYLQKLWEELGSLPAIFPDGRPLHAKIDPWLLNDLVRAHLPKLNVSRPFLSYFQLWISVLLAWWVVPITLFLFWGRYLPRHERAGTTFHVALLVISLTAALALYRLAVTTLRGIERKPFTLRGTLTSLVGYQAAAFAVAVGVLFGMVSQGAIIGVPSDAPIFGLPLRFQRSEQDRRWQGMTRRTLVPRLMALVGFSPFADLTGAEISQRQSPWSQKDEDLNLIARARLEGADLRYAIAPRAFLADADLFVADLSGADLNSADLRRAYLSYAVLSGADLRAANIANATLFASHLRGADLQGADLRGANLNDADLRDASLAEDNLFHSRLRGASLENADLRGANLGDADLRSVDLGGADVSGADLTYADFREALVLDPEAVKGGIHWDKAFYDEKILKALGLPPNHNTKLAEQQKKERKL
jgi:uncharacterized protein YjbI with pentapeptide repeats